MFWTIIEAILFVPIILIIAFLSLTFFGIIVRIIGELKWDIIGEILVELAKFMLYGVLFGVIVFILVFLIAHFIVPIVIFGAFYLVWAGGRKIVVMLQKKDKHGIINMSR